MNVKYVTFDSKQSKFESNVASSFEISEGEVVVKILCCTICGSDLHSFSGRRACPDSCVLGHEIVGEVESVKAPVPNDDQGCPIRVGQRVTWCMAVGCGQCFYCQNGLPQKCDQLFKYGHEQLNGTRVTGGFATHCLLVAGTPLFTVPEGLPNTVVSPANCATATVFACLRRAQRMMDLEGRNVLVTGLGMLGLTACAALVESGAKAVVGVDLSPERCQIAERFGVQSAVPANDTEEIKKRIEELTQSRGYDLALDFSGANAAIDSALNSLRPGGQLILAGSVFPSKSLSFDCEKMVRRMWTVSGVHNYAPEDLAEAIRFLNENHKKYPFDALVSKTFSLEEIELAVQAAETGEHVRVAVVPG